QVERGLPGRGGEGAARLAQVVGAAQPAVQVQGALAGGVLRGDRNRARDVGGGEREGVAAQRTVAAGPCLFEESRRIEPDADYVDGHAVRDAGTQPADLDAGDPPGLDVGPFADRQRRDLD